MPVYDRGFGIKGNNAHALISASASRCGYKDCALKATRRIFIRGIVQKEKLRACVLLRKVIHRSSFKFPCPWFYTSAFQKKRKKKKLLARMSRPNFEQLTRKYIVYIVFREYMVYFASIPSKCFYTRSREIVDTRKRQDKRKDGGWPTAL